MAPGPRLADPGPGPRKARRRLGEFLDDLRGGPWRPVTRGGLAAGLGVLGGLAIAILASPTGFVPIVDHTNVAIHEAGHVIFGWLGATASLYGGTLMQFVFPLAALASFWRRRQPVSCAVSAAWLFENLLPIARYMADARAQALPLVGGTQHDWLHIFVRWGVLESDTRIARGTEVVAWIGLLACAAWLVRRWARSRACIDRPMRV
jgi:hypothetical protein